MGRDKTVVLSEAREGGESVVIRKDKPAVPVEVWSPSEIGKGRLRQIGRYAWKQCGSGRGVSGRVGAIDLEAHAFILLYISSYINHILT